MEKRWLDKNKKTAKDATIQITNWWYLYHNLAPVSRQSKGKHLMSLVLSLWLFTASFSGFTACEPLGLYVVSNIYFFLVDFFCMHTFLSSSKFNNKFHILNFKKYSLILILGSCPNPTLVLHNSFLTKIIPCFLSGRSNKPVFSIDVWWMCASLPYTHARPQPHVL